MHIMLCLGGVKICLDCEKEIQIEDVFLPFIIRERSGISGQDEKWKETDILAAVSWKWVKPPLRSAVKLGEDLIQTYYRREEKNYCIVWEGEKGAISCVEYDDTFSHVSCRIQERLLPVAPKSLGEILRYFPMRAILQQFLVLFFSRGTDYISGNRDFICRTIRGGKDHAGKTLGEVQKCQDYLQ